jgi:hypothetical protein
MYTGFVWGFGMLALTGSFLVVFWGNMAWCRVKKIGWQASKNDRLFLLSSTFTITALGTILIHGARAVSNIHYGLSAHLKGPEGMFIGTGIAFILIGQMIIVWIADLERPNPIWLWGMGIIGAMWAVIASYFTGLFHL